MSCEGKCSSLEPVVVPYFSSIWWMLLGSDTFSADDWLTDLPSKNVSLWLSDVYLQVETSFPLILGTIRSNYATAMRTSLKKWICVLSVFIAIIPTTCFVKCRRTLLELNSEASYPTKDRQITFRRCLFTSSRKCGIRHVYFVVVQKRAEEMYKKAWCTCKVVVLLIKPIVFLTFSLPSGSLDLEVPILTATQTLKSEPEQIEQNWKWNTNWANWKWNT